MLITERFQKEMIKNVSLNYFLSLPDAIKQGESVPMIVFLHGAGERGDDIDLVKSVGLPRLCVAGLSQRCIVLCPQCPQDQIWNALIPDLKLLIDSIAEQYTVDTNRISITGLSMGGFGTWEMISTYPSFFSAAAPICGGGMEWRTDVLLHLPIWAFHGDDDTVVECGHSIRMVERIKEQGGKAQLTIFHGVGHNAWDSAYEQTELINWLLAQKKA